MTPAWGRAARRIPNQASAASAVWALCRTTPATIAQGGISASLSKRSRIQSLDRDAEQVEDEDREGDAADPERDPPSAVAAAASATAAARLVSGARTIEQAASPVRSRACCDRSCRWRSPALARRSAAARPRRRARSCSAATSACRAPSSAAGSTVPMRRADPSLGTTRVAFARAHARRPRAALAGDDHGDGRRARATPRPRRRSPARWSRCWRRCCAATTSSSSTSAAPAARDGARLPGRCSRA